MTTEPESSGERFPSPLSDEQIERLVRAALAVPAISSAFEKDLLSQLTAGLADAPRGIPESKQFSSNGSGTYATGEAASGAPVESILFEPRPAVKAAPARRRFVGWVACATVAASLLGTFGLFASYPAYGWASMIAALEKCSWVQALSPSVSPDDSMAEGVSTWLSVPRRIVARRTHSGSQYTEFARDCSRYFDASQDVVVEASLDGVSFESELYLALLPGLDSAGPIDWALLPPLKVLTESWHRVHSAEGKREVILLQVKLGPKNKAPDLARETYDVDFTLDPASKLPLSATWQRSDKSDKQSVEFSYPEQGPESIYALGVPRETPVIASSERHTVRLTTAPDDETAFSEPQVAGAPSPVAEAEKVIEVRTPALTTSATQHAKVTVSAQVAPEEPQRVASPEEPAVPLPEPLSDGELVEHVNNLLADYWEDQGVTPAQRATDTEFLRRVYLDLTGRIPMVSEVYQFLENPSEDRRQQLVDDLLSRRDHATHLATVWRSILLPDGVDLSRFGGTSKFDSWLADRFAQNAPYDEIVRQLLLAEGRVSESGPLLFYAALKLNPEELAARTSRVFLGTRMECAQCHDHPFDDRIAQQDFWGFAAHFAQISRPEGKMEMTSPVLRVHDSSFGEVKLPDSETVVAPSLPRAGLADFESDESDLPRRRRLVDWLTNEHNDEFARAAVNRLWQQLFGRGLVEPVDDMRPDNEAICPQLLEELSQDFAASGFNVRRMLRALVLSDAYQLSSASESDDPSQALCFARMNMKVFTAAQLYDCIAVATRNESAMQKGASDNSLARTENASREGFIRQFQAVGGARTDFQTGIPQALALMHGGVVYSATDLSSSGLLKSLQAPFFTDEQRLETLFLSTLSRPPTDAESERLVSYVQDASDSSDRNKRLGDVLWALLNSAEFVFIH